MSDTRPTVLVLLGCFSRGVEATGPNQSLIGMAEMLSDRYRFRVIASAVEGDEVGRWTNVRGVEQLPLHTGRLAVRGLRQAIRATPHDVLITNSLMDHLFTGASLWMRRLGLVPRRPVLLAPRGELSSGTLEISAARKRAYLAFLSRSGLLRGLSFQATNEAEAAEIRAAVGQAADVWVTPNIRRIPPLPPHRPRAPGEPLRIAYLSRIDRKKNLDFALQALAEAAVPVRFDIYGPVSNHAYWRACEAQIAAIPASVEVRHHGAIGQSAVPAALANADLFFLPTRGENFGHAIADALIAGTPALLSDQTPWRGLEQAGAGWDLPLSDPSAFVAAVRRSAAMTPGEAAAMRSGARRFVEAELDPERAAAMLALCLEELIRRRARAGERDHRNIARG
jgi:glycosyltransferase involved in cell wall biosynthesis